MDRLVSWHSQDKYLEFEEKKAKPTKYLKLKLINIVQRKNCNWY